MAILITAVISIAEDYNHFTWWSLATFDGICILGVFDLDIYFFYYFETIQILVIISVILMAYLRCTVFTTAWETHSSLEFILGDLNMHYIPSIVVLAMQDFKKLHKSFNVDVVVVQLWLAYGTYMTWLFFHNPFSVYGCSNIQKSIAITAPFFMILLSTLATSVYDTMLKIQSRK
jgi:hypothetical protein